MDLLALVDFNLVARYGGMGRAARATGRPKATLSRRVVELESSLGLRLFERGARVLKLTEEGKALHQRTSVLLNEIDETAGAIARAAPLRAAGCASARRCCSRRRRWANWRRALRCNIPRSGWR